MVPIVFQHGFEQAVYFLFYGRLQKHHRILRGAAKKAKSIQIIRTQQEAAQKILGEIDHIAVRMQIEVSSCVPVRAS